MLTCGHRCPSLCGESCPEAYCQLCSGREDARVDLLEMKSYGEINLEDSPIIVLGCGHFFTAETLDGLMGMGEVYKQDERGAFTGLRDTSLSLAKAVPRCPDCQCPMRQYCAQRYNRVINRAVVDEMSKRFLLQGKLELRELELRIDETDRTSHDFLDEMMQAIKPITHQDQVRTALILIEREATLSQNIGDKFAAYNRLKADIQRFRKKAADKNQPAQKLHDATVNAARMRSIDQIMSNIHFEDSVPAIARDRRVTFGGCVVELQVQCLILTQGFQIIQILKAGTTSSPIKIPGGPPDQSTEAFFKACTEFIADCGVESLPKLAVQATLCHARVARLNESYCRSRKVKAEQASRHMVTARNLLQEAHELCTQPFQGAEQLGVAVQEAIKLLSKEWYEEITSEELAAIKSAMVGGSGGIATHSGHWYNCANGHPVSFRSIHGLLFHLLTACSLRSGNVACRCKRPAAQSVEQQ